MGKVPSLSCPLGKPCAPKSFTLPGQATAKQLGRFQGRCPTLSLQGGYWIRISQCGSEHVGLNHRLPPEISGGRWILQPGLLCFSSLSNHFLFIVWLCNFNKSVWSLFVNNSMGEQRSERILYKMYLPLHGALCTPSVWPSKWKQLFYPRYVPSPSLSAI